jgi:hypothetical protein
MRSWLAVVLAACAGQPAFPLREPLATDPDQRPFAPMPAVYWSPLVWDGVDNTLFARVSRGLAIDVGAEAANVNSVDEVADSSWFQNRGATSVDGAALGGCTHDDLLPDDVVDGGWTIDHGKDEGATPGFRVTVPDKGKYLLKADNDRQLERNSAASVIGNALYHAAGFNAPCEQVVYVRRAQFVLKPGLTITDNSGVAKPFNEAALRKVLASSSRRGDRVRMEASKWLPGVALGPFRYIGTRADDRNDIIAHQDRRELRGSRILAAWMSHFDAREENSFDTWIAVDDSQPRGAGYVRHYILDTNDAIGGEADPPEFTSRLGLSYYLDFADVGHDFITLGADERPWERVRRVRGREKFGYFTADSFDPATWKPGYPNPAFSRMTERDAAWMARIIARITPEQIRAIAVAARFGDPSDVDYITGVLLARRRTILSRYLNRLSPIADVRVEADGTISATDLAIATGVARRGAAQFRVVQRSGTGTRDLPVDVDPCSGHLRFAPVAMAGDASRDDDAQRITIFDVTGAGGPLEIHAYDLGRRGFRVVGLVRRDPG